MKSPTEKRADVRVEFARGIDVHIVALDGTWRLPALMLDAAENGAKLKAASSIENLNLAEFFLLLSTTGGAFRRCKLAWVNGDQIGVRFLAKQEKPKGSRPKGSHDIEPG